MSNAIPTPEATNVNVTTEATNGEKVEKIMEHNVHQEKSTDVHTHVSATNHASEKSTTEEYFNKKLQDFANNVVSAFANKSLGSYKKFCENAIAVVKAYDGVDKEQMRLELESFEEFYSDMKDLEKSFDTSYSFSLLEYVAGIFYILDLTGDFAIEEKNPSYKRNFIESFLKRHKFESLVSEFYATAKKFMKTLKSQVNGFWQKLPSEERGTEEDFEKWYADFVDFKYISASTFSDD